MSIIQESSVCRVATRIVPNFIAAEGGWTGGSRLINCAHDDESIDDHSSAPLRDLGTHRIGVFGFFVRGDARTDSDVDVYVEFDDARRTYDNFFALHERLGALLGRRVDLVTTNRLPRRRRV